jgi:hypothetical protein
MSKARQDAEAAEKKHKEAKDARRAAEAKDPFWKRWRRSLKRFFKEMRRLSPMLRSLTFRVAFALVVCASLITTGTILSILNIRDNSFRSRQIEAAGMRQAYSTAVLFTAQELLIGDGFYETNDALVHDLEAFAEDYLIFHQALIAGNESMRVRSIRNSGVLDTDSNEIPEALMNSFFLQGGNDIFSPIALDALGDDGGANPLPPLDRPLQVASPSAADLLVEATGHINARYRPFFHNPPYNTTPFDPVVAGVTGLNLTQLNADRGFRYLQRLVWDVLDKALSSSIDIFFNELGVVDSKVTNLEIGFFVTEILALLILQVVIFRRLFEMLSGEAMRTLDFLRIIPAKIIESVPRLRSLEQAATEGSTS